jgi:recombination protein RecT
MSTANTAIQKREVLEAITAAKVNIVGRLTNGMDADRFILGVQTAIQKNPALLQCDPKSVLLAAYDAAELGINLSPSLSLGYLIPYGQQCNFQVSYRGLIQKSYETKAVKAFFAEVVYEHDKFERQFAPKRNLFHAPADGDRGEKIGAYAFIEFVDGTVDWEFMTTEQVERRRKHSKQPDSLMWTKFWEEGYKKTPIRNLWKRIPLSNPGMERLAEVINREAEAESELEPAGRLELEPDATLPAPRQIATPSQPVQDQPIAQAAPSKFHDFSIYVGPKESTVTGDVKKIVSNLPQLGAKLLAGGRAWFMPSARVHELLELCDKKGVTYIEVDLHGTPISKEEPTEDTEAQSLFDA